MLALMCSRIGVPDKVIGTVHHVKTSSRHTMEQCVDITFFLTYAFGLHTYIKSWYQKVATDFSNLVLGLRCWFGMRARGEKHDTVMLIHCVSITGFGRRLRWIYSTQSVYESASFVVCLSANVNVARWFQWFQLGQWVQRVHAWTAKRLRPQVSIGSV